MASPAGVAWPRRTSRAPWVWRQTRRWSSRERAVVHPANRRGWLHRGRPRAGRLPRVRRRPPAPRSAPVAGRAFLPPSSTVRHRLVEPQALEQAPEPTVPTRRRRFAATKRRNAALHPAIQGSCPSSSTLYSCALERPRACRGRTRQQLGAPRRDSCRASGRAGQLAALHARATEASSSPQRVSVAGRRDGAWRRGMSSLCHAQFQSFRL